MRIHRADVRTDQSVDPPAAPAIWIEGALQCMDCGTTDPPELFYPIAAMSRPPNAPFPGYQLCNPCERKRRQDLGGSLIIGPDPRRA